MPEKEISSGSGIAKHSRYGGATGSYQVFKRGITANETAPTERNKGSKKFSFAQRRWVFIADPAITAYTVHFMRWVEALSKDGADVLGLVNGGRWVEDKAVTYASGGDQTELQVINSDRCSVYIDGIAGGPGTGITVLHKGVPRHA